jgi:NAD(P)-dependent dehydrogenase (short-subunit alcohol dehydrogenase family)
MTTQAWPFTRDTTAAEVLAGIDLSGRSAVATGGASGIGIETARALAEAGAEVTIAVRNTEAGEKVAADIGRNVLVQPLDLADRASVAAFTANWDGPLHMLVDNAGIMASPLMRTPEGWEMQFATNHLGHFALANGLHDALALAAGARVVSVSSAAHLRSPVVFEDIHFDRRGYEPWLAYGQSKTANVLFAVGITQRWADDGIVANALHPGGIRTNLQRYVSEDDLARMRSASGGSAAPAWKTPQQGAATSVLLAASPLVEGVSGRYFEDVAEAAPNRPGTRTGYAPYAVDPEAADRLWRVSQDILSA